MNDCIELFASDAAIPCTIPVLTEALCEALEPQVCGVATPSVSYAAMWQPIRAEIARLDAELCREARLDAWLFGTSVITDALCDDSDLDLNF